MKPLLRKGKAAIIALLGISLTACQTARAPEPIIRTVRVNVPIAIQCVPANTPTTPPARQALGTSGEVGTLIQQITAELIERRQYDDLIAPVLEACRHTP